MKIVEFCFILMTFIYLSRSLEIKVYKKYCNKGVFCKGFCEENGYPQLKDYCMITNENPSTPTLKRCTCVLPKDWTPNN
uniref:Defensin-like protein n=1 Tax=Strongyloides papillosus TaxID=174720 RepID=A0A0N5BHV4_STREA